MYITSTEFKELATSDRRVDKAYVVIDGVTYDDSPDGRLDSIKFEYKSDSFIGGFNAASVVVDLYYEGLSDLNWIGKEIEVHAGFDGAEFVPIGTFLIPNDEDAVSTDDGAQVVTLTAYDFAIDFDFQYTQVSLPATGRQIMTEVANRNGVDLDPNSPPLLFDDFVFTEINVNVNEIFSDRELVNQYAALNLSVATINRETQLTFKSVFEHTTPHLSVDGNNYQDIKVEAEEGPINSLVYEQGDVDDPVWVKDETSIDAFGLTEAKIKENVFISLMDRTAQQTIINLLFTVINGYTYTPFEIDGYDARPDLDPFDLIEVLDTSDVPHIAPIMNISWEYAGSLDGSLSSEVLPETLTDYSLSGTEQDLLNMGIKVNRIDKRITLEINDIQQEIKDIELTPGKSAYEIALEQGFTGSEQDWLNSLEGTPGENGITTYTWVKYADTPTTGMSDIADGKKYIGLAFNKDTSTESEDYNDYQWSLMPQNMVIGGRNYILQSAEDIDFSELDDIETEVQEGDFNPPPEDLQHAHIYTLSSPINKGVLTLSIYEDDWYGVWGNDDYFLGYLEDGKLDIDVDFDIDHLIVKSLAGTLISHIKFEKGGTRTDWTPAPEDVEETLTEVKTGVLNNSAAIEMLPDSIIDSVSETFTLKDEFGDYKQEVSTQFSQTAHDYEFLFSQIEEYVSTLDEETQSSFQEFRKYIRFIDGEIHLGNDEENTVELQIRNNRISFMQQGLEVAYISNNKLYITDGHFLNSLRVGNFEFRPRDNGSLSFGKVV